MNYQYISILIIGAGPTGLTAACELARHGVPCQIIDKLPQPVSTSNALAMQARTCEVLQDMGIIDQALAVGNPLRGMNMYADGKRIAHMSLTDLPTQFPFVLGISQQETEKLLNAHLATFGLHVERSTELIDVQQDEHHATVIYKTATENKKITCDYLLACDGYHSAVREKLNIPFVGENLEEHFVMADLSIDWALPHNEAHVFLSSDGPLAVISLTDFSRVIVDVTKHPTLANSTSPTLDDFKQLVIERCNIPVQLSNPIWTSGFWIHRRLADKYRDKRIFLLGDSAHVHSPVGGQGMNTGIQDAYNLAWKLAMVQHGDAKPWLLDSYESERLLKDSGINRTKTTFNQEYAKRLLMKGQSMISTDHFTASHQRYLACRRALHKMQVQFIKLDLLNTKSIDCFKRILEQHSVTITVINLSNIFDYDGNYALRNHGTQPAKTWNTTGRLYDSLERCCEVEQQLIILYSRIELDENKRIQRLISRHAASVDEYILQTTEYSMQANKFFSSYQYDFNKPKKSTNLKNTKPIF